MMAFFHKIALRMIDNSYERAITLGRELHLELEKKYPGIIGAAHRDNKIIGFPVGKNGGIPTYHLFDNFPEATAWATQAVRGHAVIVPGDICDYSQSGINEEDILTSKHMKHVESIVSVEC